MMKNIITAQKINFNLITNDMDKTNTKLVGRDHDDKKCRAENPPPASS